MTNALIIFLAYGFYIFVVGMILVLSWYSEKLDPHSELPDSILDEILPNGKFPHWYQQPQPQPQRHRPAQIVLPALSHKY